ncbi:MAG TPA: hypothetical protein DEQ47_14100 [Solibacterales bacterium]|nr:hypothetical protein [Bryobacterales bacterium]
MVEGQSPKGASTKRYSVFSLHDHINASAVKAELSNRYLTIVAPKAEATAAGPKKDSSADGSA